MNSERLLQALEPVVLDVFVGVETADHASHRAGSRESGVPDLQEVFLSEVARDGIPHGVAPSQRLVASHSPIPACEARVGQGRRWVKVLVHDGLTKAWEKSLRA